MRGQVSYGQGIINAQHMYRGCSNLTGRPIIGDNVVNAYRMFGACPNLTLSPKFGDNIENFSYLFHNSPNICGNTYIFSEKEITSKIIYIICSGIIIQVYD